jgi:hypothetical protein
MTDKRDARIERSINIIGASEEADFELNPQLHAEHISCGSEFSSVLQNSRVQAERERYREFDSDAICQQDRYKSLARQARWMMLLSTCAGVATIAAVGFVSSTDWVGRWAVSLLALCSAIFSAWGATSVYRLKQGHLLDRWMGARAAAEECRIGYFRKILETWPKESDRIDLGLLKLEYFRRYQLEVQIAYYSKRGNDHSAASDTALRIAGIAFFLSTLASSIAVSSTFVPVLGLMAALTPIGAAIAAFSVSMEATNQDARNAERYRRTLDALLIAKGQLDEVREAIVNGDQDVLFEFAVVVQERMSAEHRQWLEAAECRSSAIERLEQSLMKHRNELDQ